VRMGIDKCCEGPIIRRRSKNGTPAGCSLPTPLTRQPDVGWSSGLPAIVTGALPPGSALRRAERLPMVTATELRTHFSVRTPGRRHRTIGSRYDVCLCGRLVDEHFDEHNRKRTCEELAKRSAERLAAPSSEAVSRSVVVKSLVITPDAMPGHHVARAVILDL